ncbi:MAG: methyltransferase domain-containing protein [Acidobacteria bacterium]|nr:MAG: methyltransferase domain-containing protein [Acidobacteriota bacterium]
MGRPDPVLLWDTFNAYQRTAALDAALDLDVFTAVAEGHRTVPQLAASCKGSERGVRILCDYLTTLGFFTKKNGEYDLTPTSAVFLNRHSPHYKGSIAQFLNMPELMASYTRLADVIRKGKAAMEGSGTVDPEDPVWVVFAKSMAPMMGPSADFVASLTNGTGHRKVRVLDIAAGHGLFGIAVARQNPEAEIVALDWPAVLEVARENAAQAGVHTRYQTIAGDAFQVDFKGPYDVVLLTNFLHHFSESDCVSLLRKVHASLKPGGRVVTLEFVPNDDRVSPPIPAAFSLIMLAGTPEGDAYTFQELSRMFTAAGFGPSKIVPVPESPQCAIVTEKK